MTILKFRSDTSARISKEEKGMLESDPCISQAKPEDFIFVSKMEVGWFYGTAS